MKCYTWEQIKDLCTHLEFHAMRVDEGADEPAAEVMWEIDPHKADITDLRYVKCEPMLSLIDDEWKADPKEYRKAAKVGLAIAMHMALAQTIRVARWCEYDGGTSERCTHLIAPVMSTKYDGGVYDTWLFATCENRFSLTVTGDA